MKILLLGKNGQVGSELVRYLAPLGKLVALDRHGEPGICGDLEQTDRLREMVRKLEPDVIVNAAAYTAVDKAEANADLAMQVNCDGPRVLAEEAGALGSCLIHYSTDYVFDGSSSEPYNESSTTNPLSVYGRTKLAGERAVADACGRHLIIRTSWVFGVHGNNFLKTILRLAAQETSLRIVSDQTGAPTSAQLIASVSAKLLSEMFSATPDDERWGIYHLTAAGVTSWHGYARYVVEKASSYGVKSQVLPNDILPIPTSEYPVPARRPANSVLDTSKLRKSFGIDLPHWERGVDEVLASITAY
jgi:dTDP-4-dehydrorhamnose reductase